MDSFYKSIFIIFVLLIVSCKTTKDVVYEAPIMEERTLDTVVVTAKKDDPNVLPTYMRPVYNASATRRHDLLHTKLEVSFDWAQQHVLGVATLKLKPYFYDTDILLLDAKVFDINSITLNGKSLEYDYDMMQLEIQLDKVYNKDEEYTIVIDYTAKPNEGPSSGSAAITSDKGLFFINPNNSDPNKPQQIWTQGETENSSRWFPTIDKPNERCTQEIYITVDDKYETLSNGKLISSNKNPNGTRTDYWKQDKPHAPYLFMVGIGEYAVVKDSWGDIPLMYYVEKDYEKDAEKIFEHTPEMLQFFSDKLGFKYPWDKYAQIVCRDYVSGAMENTGAVVFGEFVQKHTDELLDGNNDDIVAHEMFHHWFGDLVTCESWSNLTLNEGFATYSEVMWQEHKYGPEAADRKRLQDMNAYLMSAGQQGTHDLIDFEYGNKEEMFDAHSYSKGGLIVHMLRSYVGDDAFFAALKNYLNDNAYSDVEAHELRLAFEDTMGEDLNWFFNQWFFDQGHPILTVDYNIDAESKSVFFAIEQTQDPEDNPAIFQLPVNIRLYYPSGKVETIAHTIDERKQEITIDIVGEEMPAVAVLDGTHDLLAVINTVYTDQEYADLYTYSDEYVDKMEALKKLKGKAKYDELFLDAANHDSKYIKALGLSAIDSKAHMDLLKQMALTDEDSGIRASALKKIKDYDVAQKLMTTDASYKVKNEAFKIIKSNDKEEAIKIADRMLKGNYEPMISSIADVYASTGDEKYLAFFDDNISKVGMFEFFSYTGNYSKLAKKASPEAMLESAQALSNLATDESSMYFKKYSATNMIRDFSIELDKRNKTGTDADLNQASDKLKSIIANIVNTTTDQRLKSAFSDFVSP